MGGGGGGRPDFAEAGGKDPSKIDELIATAPAVLHPTSKLIADVQFLHTRPDKSL